MLEGDGQRGLLPSCEKIEAFHCRGKDDYNGEERRKSGLDLNSVLTLGNKQLHTDGVPPSCVSGPGCHQALPSTSFQSESHPVPLGPTDPAGSIIKRH